MGKEIVINAQKDQMRIAIVEDGDLAEMYFEDPNNERTLGDIHLGRVRRIMPSIKAAFIDVGQPSDAFLHFSDIADNVGDMLKLVAMQKPDVSEVELSENTRAARRHRPRAPMGAPVSLSNEEDDAEEDAVKANKKPARRSRDDSGRRDFRPESFLKRDQKILVKIVKEPISAKGSRVSTDISLAGRFLVLVPLADYVAVSKKIVSYKERRRLRALAKSLLPKGFGLIVRTVAEGKNAKTLDTDLRLLIDKWRRIEKRMFEVKDPPALMHQDVNMVSSVIRDLFSDDYDRILVDDQKVYRNIKGYIQAVAPQMAPAVQLHSDRTPVFKEARIDRAVGLAFESRVPLPSGGYLIIEHTEAMHVVDVNSGRAGKGLSQEQNSLKVNLESARMIAQQLRIRDLGGIIVVDFIDLRDEKNRRKVHDELRREFTKDRAVTKVLPMSDFGVVQITRQRLRPSITTKKSTADAMKGMASAAMTSDSGSADKGASRSKSGRKSTHAVTPDEMIAKIEKWLKRHKSNGGSGPLVLKVHPFASAFLQRGFFNANRKWLAKYFIRIKIEGDEDLEPMVFRIYDAKTNEELTRRKRSGRRRG
ncbi:MAG: Rne/Rng family ribonuclease, partial [Rhodothermales bacterium]|nr:Rne/Rng family ribonuclease [Rhodothermales bacterium]